MKIYRHAAPNMYDHAPVGTECWVAVGMGEFEIYIQRNKETDKPVWEYIGKDNVTS